MCYRILLIGSSPGIGLTFRRTHLALALKRIGNEVNVLSINKEQYDSLPKELEQFNIIRYTSNGLHKSDPINLINVARDIRKLILKNGDFDLVIGGGIREGISSFLAVRKLKKRPIIFSMIGSLPQSSNGMRLAFLSYNYCYDKNIALCNYTKAELTKFGVNQDKIYAIPLNAPDLSRFDESKKIKINLKDYYLNDVDGSIVFYAASHFNHKGFQYYLMAASKVLEKFDATFVVGGKGPLTSSFKELANKLGISKHVVFTGWISNYHMPHILSNISNVCVSTSLVDQLPAYVMECMAAGKPVVASSIGGVPEIILNNVNGFLVPPFDYKETARFIIDLLSNPEKAKEMGEAGRKIIDEKLNMDVSVRTFIKTYEQLF
jgi:glycosyltransferase involved in cell wall biosynthesis